MPEQKRTSLNTERALLLLLAVLWGGSYTFIKIGVETIPPLTLIAARTLVAGLILLGMLKWRGLEVPLDKAVWKRFFIQALLNSVFPFTLIAWAESRLEAGTAVILSSTTPIFAFLLTAVLTRHEAVTPAKIFGVVAGFIGICLIVGMGAIGHGNGTFSLATVLPEIAILTASAFYGGAAIFGKNFKGLNPMVPATGSFLCGAALLIPTSLIVDRPWTLAPSMNSITALLALSCFSTALAFTIYFRLIQTLGTTGTTAQAYLRAPIGVAIGMIFLDERPAATAGIGLAAVIISVIAMTAPSKRPEPEKRHDP